MHRIVTFSVFRFLTSACLLFSVAGCSLFAPGYSQKNYPYSEPGIEHIEDLISKVNQDNRPEDIGRGLVAMAHWAKRYPEDTADALEGYVMACGRLRHRWSELVVDHSKSPAGIPADEKHLKNISQDWLIYGYDTLASYYSSPITPTQSSQFLNAYLRLRPNPDESLLMSAWGAAALRHKVPVELHSAQPSVGAFSEE